jgi:uncharacterized RDD family membrane protein YckC
VFVDRISVTTPERVLVEQEIAGVGSRAVAQMLDVIVIVLTLVASLLLSFLLAAIGLPHWFVLTLLEVQIASTPLGYFILLEWRFGATVGKRVMRIRVVTEQGAPIGMREALVRNLLRPIDLLPGSYLLGGVVAIASRRSQRLGDMAAGTVAVRPPRRRRLATGTAGSFVEMVSANETASTLIPGQLAEIIAEFESRKSSLTKEARAALASKIATRVERDLPRPHGMNDDQFLAYARGRYS